MCFAYWSVYGAPKRISNMHVPEFLILYLQIWICKKKKKKYEYIHILKIFL